MQTTPKQTLYVQIAFTFAARRGCSFSLSGDIYCRQHRNRHFATFPPSIHPSISWVSEQPGTCCPPTPAYTRQPPDPARHLSVYNYLPLNSEIRLAVSLLGSFCSPTAAKLQSDQPAKRTASVAPLCPPPRLPGGVSNDVGGEGAGQPPHSTGARDL